MSLDPDVLFDTIISASKASLKCETCHVYLWSPADATLRNALGPRTRGEAPRPDNGMAGWVVENRQILTRSAVESDYALRSLRDEDPGMPDAIAPLTVGGELLGLLIVDGIEQESPTFMRLLYILADMYALGIKNSQLFKRIEEMARRDGLTGLFNHASFHEELQRLFDSASSGSWPLSVVMGDIDHFKELNDTYGHQAGDHVLREVARLWNTVLPEGAKSARYGGEEFICALSGEERTKALELAELLRRRIESHVFDFEGRRIHVTSSFGVADVRQASTMPMLVRFADEALYAAKQSGRNRVMCSRAGHQAGGAQPTRDDVTVETARQHS
jgi:diguanylate cyclase (GGDEF)-like protein